MNEIKSWDEATVWKLRKFLLSESGLNFDTDMAQINVAAVLEGLPPRNTMRNRFSTVKHVFRSSLLRLKNVSNVEPFAEGQEKIKLHYRYLDTVTVLKIMFDNEPSDEVITVYLNARTRSSYIKLNYKNIPIASKCSNEALEDFIWRIRTAISNTFCKQIFDKLKTGQSLAPSPSVSSTTSGSRTPGGVYLGRVLCYSFKISAPCDLTKYFVSVCLCFDMLKTGQFLAPSPSVSSSTSGSRTPGGVYLG